MVLTPFKFMLDSMIYDLVASEQELSDRIKAAVVKGTMTVLSTHIQEDQLAATPDLTKRNPLLSTLSKITPNHIPTAGAVWDMSKWGDCTWGNGSDSGIGLEQVASPGGGHVADALVATTAAREADVLVTEDKRLRNRLRGLGTGCEVWGFERFRAHVLGL